MGQIAGKVKHQHGGGEKPHLDVDVKPYPVSVAELTDVSLLRESISPNRWREIKPVIDKMALDEKIRLSQQVNENKHPEPSLMWDSTEAFRVTEKFGVPAVKVIAKFGYPAVLAIADYDIEALRSIIRFGYPAARVIARFGYLTAEAIDKHGKPALDLILKHGWTASQAIGCHGKDAITAIHQHGYPASSEIFFCGQEPLKIFLGTKDTKEATRQWNKRKRELERSVSVRKATD